MNNEKILSLSSEISLAKNSQEFKFRRQNDKALTNISSGKEIWYFKNEILKDIKMLEKNLTDKFNSANLNLKDDVKNLNENISSLEIKLKELSTKITEDNSIKEKVDNLEIIKSKILNNILVTDMKVTNLDKEMRQSIIDMNNTLKETVIYAGVIGPTCKFKTFHEFIDYIVNEINVLGTFKEKNMMDVTSFKKKIESNVQGFKMQLESFGRSSTQFTTDNFNRVDKAMNKLFHQCDDKIDNIQSNLDEKLEKTDKKIEDFEIKLIKEISEIKDRINTLEKNMNTHIKHYLNFKEEMSKLNENVPKKTHTRNSVMNNIESTRGNNNLNKNKINRRKSAARNDKIEEIKNNNTNNKINNNVNNNINNHINDKIIININEEKNEKKEQDLYNEEESRNIISAKKHFIKVKGNENVKTTNDIPELNNLNKDLKINVENSNSFNLNKYIKDKVKKRADTQNSFAYKTNLLLSHLEQEDEKMKSFSPERKSIRIKNIKNSFNISHHSIDSVNSKISIKTIDNPTNNMNNFEIIKPMNILNQSQSKKGKEKEKEKEIINIKSPIIDKNTFNKTLKFSQNHNKLWFFGKQKKNIKRQKSINNINSLNIDNNNNRVQNIFHERYNIYYPKTYKSSTKFKNIILTLDGTKKMIYETKDFKKGKNLYHIESLSDKNGKKSTLRERFESCKPFLLDKNYKNGIYSFQNLGKEEPFDFIKYKNHKFLLKKSASYKIYLSNKNSAEYDYNIQNLNNNLSPSFSITKYNFPKKNRYVTSEEKSFQTEKI